MRVCNESSKPENVRMQSCVFLVFQCFSKKTPQLVLLSQARLFKDFKEVQASFCHHPMMVVKYLFQNQGSPVNPHSFQDQTTYDISLLDQAVNLGEARKIYELVRNL